MKILIVDDDPIIINIFTTVAKSIGHTDITTANSGEDALTLVIREAYDLITLDIAMPGASGLEVLSVIRNLCPHAIIVIISGYMPEEISSEVAGCADVIIAKPFKLDIFKQLLTIAARVCEGMEEIRHLGNVSLTVR